MKDGKIIFLLSVVGILSGAEIFVIFTTIPPSSATNDVLWLFFGCIFLFLTTALGLVWHPIKQKAYRRITISRWQTIRQAALVSLVITTTLLLQSLHILSLWDLIPLALSAILIEFFFAADKRQAYYEPTR